MRYVVETTIKATGEEAVSEVECLFNGHGEAVPTLDEALTAVIKVKHGDTFVYVTAEVDECDIHTVH